MKKSLNCKICKLAPLFYKKYELCEKCYQKQYYKNNKEKMNKRHREYCITNKEKVKEYNKQYRIDNIEKITKVKQKYDKENRKRLNAYRLELKKTDLNFKLGVILRSRLGVAIKYEFKSGSAIKDLGISIEEFRIYLESKFYPNPKTGESMSWSNYGRYGWHIDHIIPLASFNLTNRNQFLKACHYTNLQPLWWFENLHKKDKTL